MKSKIMMLFAGLSLGVVACNDNASTGDAATSDTTTNTTTTTTDNTSVDVDVPAGTRTSFETKYPNATNVRWSRYKPESDRSTIDPSDWNYKLDTNDYEVMFNWDGAEYYAWYDDGNFVRASTPVKDHSKLPAAVNDAIRSQFAGYTIVEVDKEHDKDRTTYEVDLEKGEDKMKVHFDENGKVVKKKGKVDGQKTKEKEEDKH
ncbi:MAG TPA: PepSY-like domain-containing protein [Chitinophagaceae bacterium]